MVIVKQGMSDWPGNEENMTSHSNFKERFSRKFLYLVRGFFVLIWFNWGSLASMGSPLIKNWTL